MEQQRFGIDEFDICDQLGFSFGCRHKSLPAAGRAQAGPTCCLGFVALIVFFGLFLDYCSASRTCALRERAIHDHLEEVRIRTLCPMMDDVKTFADQDVLRTVSTVSPYSCNFFWCLNRLLQVLIVPQRSCYELSPAWPSVSLDLAPPFARTQKHCRPLALGKIPGDDWIASPQLAKLSSKPPTTD